MFKHLFAPLFLFDADDGGGSGAPSSEAAEIAAAAKKDEGERVAEGKKVGGGDDPPWGDPENFDAERAWKLIKNLREEKGFDKDDELRRLRKKVKDHEDASKSDQEKLTERAEGAEKERDSAKSEAARLRVALRKGLTETQAKRLVGDDEEALEKDADELLADFKGDDEGDGDGQDPPRTPREKLRPGAAPSSEPGDNDPKKLAEEVPRAY